MKNTSKAHSCLPRHRFVCVLTLLSGMALAPRLLAQNVAEAAGANSVSSTIAASSHKAVVPNAIPVSSQATQSSPHLPSSNPTTVESNRKALESKAGQDAARLLLRSSPSQAQILINNQPVGKTPQLLILPPGKYSIELRGTRQQTVRSEIALLPNEKKEVALKLETYYPTRVQLSH